MPKLTTLRTRIEALEEKRQQQDQQAMWVDRFNINFDAGGPGEAMPGRRVLATRMIDLFPPEWTPDETEVF